MHAPASLLPLPERLPGQVFDNHVETITISLISPVRLTASLGTLSDLLMTSNYPSIEQLRRALAIEEQIAALRAELAAIYAGEAAPKGKRAAAPAAAAADSGDGRKGKRSAATRAKMAAAQKARWAKLNGGEASATAEAGTEAPAPKTRKKKRQMSEEGRARIIAAQKKRWAALKAAK